MARFTRDSLPVSTDDDQGTAAELGAMYTTHLALSVTVNRRIQVVNRYFGGYLFVRD